MKAKIKLVKAAFVLSSVLFTMTACLKDAKKSDTKNEALPEQKLIEVYTETVRASEIYESSRYMGRVFSVRDFNVPSEVRGILVEKVITQGLAVKKGQVVGLVKPLLKGFDVHHHSIISPITGIVGIWNLEEGSLVDENQAVARIYDPLSLKTRIYVTEQDRSVLLDGSYKLNADLSVSQRPIDLELKVLSVGAIMDSTTLTYPVDIEIKPTAKIKLSVGTWVTVVLKSNFKKTLLISKEAVKNLDNQKKVAVIGSKGLVSWKAVQTGKYHKNNIEVLSGLKEKYNIVTRYTKKPNDGDRVKTIPTQNSATAPIEQL
ncbi:MAG: HlyD family efflux transporter periplasmic adaptor subunit [Oligoflexales bacterium]|nr:HlyD family efflux transporter periplasmic adaptor subunit [Oligoflexales bacterium]